MKIAKLKKDAIGRYDIAELPEKINEIIDVLNKSFITDDPDTIYGKTVSIEDLQNLVDITCDTVTPLPNEHTLNCVTSGEVVSDAFYVKHSPLIGNAKCPHCGESYYTELYNLSTAVYCPPIYKDGVNINPDTNTSTTRCECLNCHKEFDI
jgi:transcription elongation factor Elf1